MSDIVERLLKQAAICRDSKTIGLITKRRSEVAMFEAAAEIARLRAELAEARDKALDEAAEAMENLSFFTDVSELIGMTKQEMSERTCHEGAKAIRALKSPKPPIL